MQGTLLGIAATALASFLLFGESSPDPRAERQQLLQRGVETIAWKPGASTAHGTISGDVTWSDQDQTGFLRIDGLTPLDPEREYQLWIVDKDRPGSAPVDGGLFTLSSRGEHIIPIDAKIPVRQAAAFVITVEPKGGVVVSKQEDVVAIAAL